MTLSITRRAALGGLAGAALAPHAGLARPAAPKTAQSAGWYRFRFGEATVTVVSDGHLVTPASLIGTNAGEGEVTAFLDAHRMDTERNYAHTNHVVIDVGAARVLVDVGSGARFQPSAGRLVGNLDAAGIAPESITHVALTHAHPDHVWGMMDDFGDAPRIPAGTYAIGAREFDWWMAEDRVNSVPEAMQAFVVGARNSLAPVAERLTMADDQSEIAPGVRLVATPGHTVGHMSVVLDSGGQTLLVVGDAINHPYASFARPEWHFGFDQDKDEAVATRRRLLDMAATDAVTIVGYHLPFPGIGSVVREGGAYRFLPALWRWSE